MNDLISTIEDTKNGHLTASMYGKNAQLFMNPPHIICFSNAQCPVELMSGDRWILYEIDSKSKKLINNFYARMN
jgi:hypothetical protein